MNADHIEISNDHLRARLPPRGAGLVGLWHGGSDD